MLYGSMAPNHEDLVVHEQGFFLRTILRFRTKDFFVFLFVFSLKGLFGILLQVRWCRWNGAVWIALM